MAVVQRKRIFDSIIVNLMVLFIFTIEHSGASICRGGYSNVQNDAGVADEPSSQDDVMSLYEYSCPGPFDPKHYTECCSNNNLQGCCAQARYFYEIDNTLATIIAVSVTLVCVVITVTIIICCFWSRCPLYTACRVQYTHDIATYVSKSDNISMDTMPREVSVKGQNGKFTPVAITNGNLPVGDIEVV